MKKIILLFVILSISVIQAFSQDTWYSYQSGNWNDWTSWTLDGATAPLLNNPSNEIPTSDDKVVITSGRTITINIDDIVITEMKVLGVLDIVQTSGHDFTTTKGDGKIKIAGSGGSINFPVGDSTSFISNSSGGTLEFYGTGFDFDTDLAFNKGIVNLTNSTDILTVLADITSYGSLTIHNGVVQINDGSSSTALNLDLFDDLIIESTGSITTGSANARHQLDIYGDLTNNAGSVKFSNLDSGTYDLTAEATNGIVDVNFLDTLTDQTVTCNGTTEFYRIEINKSSKSRTLSLQANAEGNFVLFGPSNYDNDTTTSQLADNENALGLITGTVEVRTNVTIPSINVDPFSDYVISVDAALNLNGGSVTKDEGSSIFVYGYLTVTDGSLEVSSSDGLVLKDAGQFRSFGGTSDLNQLHAENSTSNGQFYQQSGGTVTIAGVDNNTSYRNFDLNFSSCSFIISGGTLNVKSGNAGTPAIRISSDADKYDASGGTLVLEFDNGNGAAFRINSTADFWNVTLKDSDGTGSNTFRSFSPLNALNDFIIEDSPNIVTYDASGYDTSIGRKFQISDGSTYTPGGNNTRFTGSLNGQIDFESTTRTLAGMDIVKDDETATVSIIQANTTTAISVSAELRIESGNLDYDTYNVESTGNIYVADSLGANGSTGELDLTGGSTQTITSEDGTLFNVNLDNSNDFVLDGDLTVAGTLTMTNGVFDIGSDKLTIDGANGDITTSGAGFSSTKMIMTSGLFGDGGLEWYIDTNGSITYPMGTDYDVDGNIDPADEQRYTPATVTVTNYSDDGYIQFIVADGVLKASKDDARTLSYSWRVKNNGFSTLPTVVYTLNYDDVDGPTSSWTQAAPAKVVGGERCLEVTGNLNETTNIITFNGDGSCTGSVDTGFTLESGQYTAAKKNSFVGQLYTYRTIRSSDTPLEWDDPTGWEELTGQGGGSGYPEEADIAIIFSDGTYWHRVVSVDGTIVSSLEYDNSNPAPGGELPQLDIIHDHTVDLGEIFGEGHTRIRVSPGDTGNETPTITADIEGTLTESGSILEYNATAEGGYDNPIPASPVAPMDLPTIYNTYPNLIIAADEDLDDDGVFDGDFPFRFTTDITATTLNIKDGGYLITNSAADGDITITDSLVVGDATNEARLQFNGTGSEHMISVAGNINIGAKGELNVEDGSDNLIHKFEAYQNIAVATGGDFVTMDANKSEVFELELKGTGNNSFTADSIGFYRVIMNKGVDTTSTFTINSNLTFHADVGGTTDQLPIVLENGLLKLNNSGIADTIAYDNDELDIVSTSGLEITSGELYVFGSSNIRLDGLLRLSGGTMDMVNGDTDGTASIRFSNTGAAKLEVTGGSLDIAGSLRRDIESETGVLTYKQTDGVVRVAVNEVSEVTKGAFEVPGASSSFTFTGGDLTIVSGNAKTSIPSILITPGTYNITDTLTIGDSNTPSNGFEKLIGINASVPLATLELNNISTNDPEVYLSTNDLVLTGSLLIDGSASVNTNGFDMTIGGDLDNDGTFLPKTGKVTFNSSYPRLISGTSTTDFYDLEKTGSDTLSLTQNVTVTNNLTITSGVLNDDGNTLTLEGNFSILGTHMSDGGEGIKMAGSDEQQITGISSGTSILGVLTIANSNGVIVPANGYNFKISDALRMNGGVFDIGGSLITIDTGATIDATTAFSISNMIQTNSSFTDNGVKKNLKDNYTTDFTFPVGQLSYTPVKFTFGSGSTGNTDDPGTILIRPANEPHPAVIKSDSILQYYWIVKSTGLNDFSADIELTYEDDLIGTDPDVSESDYVDASYIPAAEIFKKDIGSVNTTTNTISITFTSQNSDALTGDYFAGHIDAIPDSIATYISVATGDISDGVFDPVDPASPDPVIPEGSKVIIDGTHVVNFNQNSISFYETVINGTLTVPETFGHRLGDVTGTGILKLVSNTTSVTLPAGYFNDFFSATGGTLEYSGDGDYDILGGITQLRSLKISDSGDPSSVKSMGNNDLTILDDFTLAGSTFSNPNNRDISVGDDMLVSGGSYQHGASGTLSITDDLSISSGSFDGGSGGAKTMGGDLNLSGGNFSAGSAGTVSIGGDLNFTGGTFDGGSNTSKIVMNGSAAQTLNGTFISGASDPFYNLDLDNSAGFVLGGDFEIEGTLGMLDGLINPNGNKMLVLEGAAISPSIGTSSTYVIGKLYADVPDGSSFSFPIGKGGHWRYAAVNNVSSTGTLEWSAEFFLQSVVDSEGLVDNLDPSDPLVLTVAEAEYWKISDSGTGGSANVGISWDDISQVSANTGEREDLVVLLWNDGNTEWDNYGGTNFSSGHTQDQGDYVSSSAITFSEQIITLGSQDASNPLPVELVSFNGNYLVSKVQLKWTTASEFNNDYFEVQHSVDAENFNSIGIITGNGTTTGMNHYEYSHYLPSPGFNYYRLKQVDFDGEFAYSEVINVEVDSDNLPFSSLVIPNPVKTNYFTIKTNLKSDSKPVDILILNSVGSLIHDQRVYPQALQIDTEYDLELERGIYFIHVKQGDLIHTVKMAVMK